MEVLKNVKQKFIEKLGSVNNEQDLENLKVEFLGKQGEVTNLLKGIKDVPNEEKKAYGASVNDLKNEIEKEIGKYKNLLDEKKLAEELTKTKSIDLTIPLTEKTGSLHPITITEHKLIEIFTSMGFYVEDGNEIETEYNNFEAVNVPKHHPARDMQDTFYLDNGQLLKTHTSAAQNRIMKEYGAPLKVIFPGRCFRNEQLDASHENTFFQTEGMMIDENISISNLIYFMKEMLSSVFGKELNVRLRPGFFPFVEPGFELDCSCPYCGGKGCNVCKQGGWIELCPCGMIHPEVLKMGGVDIDKYQGFAFGLGLSRLTMMNFNIKDIRILNSGNLKALKQAKIK